MACEKKDHSLAAVLLEHVLTEEAHRSKKEYGAVSSFMNTHHGEISSAELIICTYVFALAELVLSLDFDATRDKAHETKLLKVFFDFDVYVDRAERTIESLFCNIIKA